MTYTQYLNFYTILNINPGATKEEIKAAYILLAKQYHPDHFQDENEKKDAEYKFKKIGEAYEELKSVDDNYNEFMTSSPISSFFEQDYSEIADMPKDSAAFFKFYFAQQELKQQEKKDLQNTKQQKTKKTPASDFNTQAIKNFEKYIKDNKLNLIYIYECIKTNTAIVTPQNRLGNIENYSSVLVQEILYRRHIKTSEEYQMFLKHRKYYNNIDLSAVLYVDSTYVKKKFDEAVKYKIKTFCPDCKGKGCDKCKNGFIEIDHITQIKVPYVSSEPLFYELKNGGNESPIGTGKLFLRVIYTNTKINESGYEFCLKNRFELNLEPIVKAAEWTLTQTKLLYNLILANKHISCLYFAISILLIIIICLAVLL